MTDKVSQQEPFPDKRISCQWSFCRLLQG